MKDLLSEPLIVADATCLDALNGFLHDETFDLDGVTFDESTNILTIPVHRQFHSGPETLISQDTTYKTYEKELMRSLVIIKTVHTWSILQNQGIRFYSFNEWEYANGIIEVRCNQALILKIIVDRLDLQITDIGFKGKTRIERGPGGIEISTGQIYE